jgi:uncharacterized membrane protein
MIKFENTKNLLPVPRHGMQNVVKIRNIGKEENMTDQPTKRTDNTIQKKNGFTTRKIATGGVLLALSVVLPLMLHVTGNPMAGRIFLPMHIPVILGGFILGPVFGLALGLAAPILSFLLLQMPVPALLPFMIIELAVYGLVSGLMFRTLRFQDKKFGIYFSLITAMIAGRAVYALSLLVAGSLLGMKVAAPVAVITGTVTGLPGIAIQLVLIPAIMFALKKGGSLNEFVAGREKNPT